MVECIVHPKKLSEERNLFPMENTSPKIFSNYTFILVPRHWFHGAILSAGEFHEFKNTIIQNITIKNLLSIVKSPSIAVAGAASNEPEATAGFVSELVVLPLKTPFNFWNHEEDD